LGYGREGAINSRSRRFHPSPLHRWLYWRTRRLNIAAPRSRNQGIVLVLVVVLVLDLLGFCAEKEPIFLADRDGKRSMKPGRLTHKS